MCYPNEKLDCKPVLKIPKTSINLEITTNELGNIPESKNNTNVENFIDDKLYYYPKFRPVVNFPTIILDNKVELRRNPLKFEAQVAVPSSPPLNSFSGPVNQKFSFGSLHFILILVAAIPLILFKPLNPPPSVFPLPGSKKNKSTTCLNGYFTFFKPFKGQKVVLTHNFSNYQLFTGFHGEIISLENQYWGVVEFELNQPRCSLEIERKLQQKPCIFIPANSIHFNK